MNSLRLSAKTLPLRSLTARSFHTNRPCFTGKTFVATDKDFDQVLKADHPVLVDFHADWCGPCRMLSPILTKAIESNPKVSLYTVDIDENPEIAQKYQIRSLPTVFAFNKGEVVDQFVGMIGKPKVETFVKNHADLAK